MMCFVCYFIIVCFIFSINDCDVYTLRLGMATSKNVEAMKTYLLSAHICWKKCRPTVEAPLAMPTSKISSTPNANTYTSLCLKISPRKRHYSVTTSSNSQAYLNCSVVQSQRCQTQFCSLLICVVGAVGLLSCLPTPSDMAQLLWLVTKQCLTESEHTLKIPFFPYAPPSLWPSLINISSQT